MWLWVCVSFWQRLRGKGCWNNDRRNGDHSLSTYYVQGTSSLPKETWIIRPPGGSVVKNLPAQQEMWVGSLGQEDPLEKGMATHSSIPTWEIPWTEQLGGLQSMGSQRVRLDFVTKPQLSGKLFRVDSWKQKRKSLSRVWLFATPWAIESMEFSRPEYWSG